MTEPTPTIDEMLKWLLEQEVLAIPGSVSNPVLERDRKMARAIRAILEQHRELPQRCGTYESILKEYATTTNWSGASAHTWHLNRDPGYTIAQNVLKLHKVGEGKGDAYWSSPFHTE